MGKKRIVQTEINNFFPSNVNLKELHYIWKERGSPVGSHICTRSAVVLTTGLFRRNTIVGWVKQSVLTLFSYILPHIRMTKGEGWRHTALVAADPDILICHSRPHVLLLMWDSLYISHLWTLNTSLLNIRVINFRERKCGSSPIHCNMFNLSCPMLCSNLTLLWEMFLSLYKGIFMRCKFIMPHDTKRSFYVSVTHMLLSRQ
jgi:hypothetical protein